MQILVGLNKVLRACKHSVTHTTLNRIHTQVQAPDELNVQRLASLCCCSSIRCESMKSSKVAEVKACNTRLTHKNFI